MMRAFWQKGRRREFHRAALIDTLERSAKTAVDYAAAFGLQITRTFSPEADFKALEEKHEARIAAFNAPGAAEKRERARLAKEKRAARSITEKIADWRAGKIRSLPADVRRCTDENGGVLLRVVDSRLETSMGASVPLADAVRVFRFVKLCKERGEAWHRNGKRLPVGHFQVDHIAPNGTFRAGCHLIHWPEIEAAARDAEVLHVESADTSESA
jgi:hypothetical protein